jgi:Tol biopolymer transport system component
MCRAACGFVIFLLGSAYASFGAAPPPTSAPTDHADESHFLDDVVQLTSGFDRAGEAYFSPDMKWIVFQATPKGEKHYAMFVAELRRDGDRITGTATPFRISPPGSRNTCGYFSPDGKSLIFASTAGKDVKEDPNEAPAGYQRGSNTYRWDFPAGMEVFRFDGWREFLQVPAVFSGATTATFENPPLKAITANDAYDAECAYSPDGKWIVFSSRRDGGDSELYVMRPDGSGVVRLTHFKGYDGGPFFSPDGKSLIYRSDRKGNDLLQIFVADVTFDEKGNIIGLRDERQITNDNNVNWGPYWHPDGRHIIYATSAHGHTNYELYLMRRDGTGKTRVTYTDGADVLPVFSPDGKYLLWASKRTPDHTTQVFAAGFNADALP